MENNRILYVLSMFTYSRKGATTCIGSAAALAVAYWIVGNLPIGIAAGALFLAWVLGGCFVIFQMPMRFTRHDAKRRH